MGWVSRVATTVLALCLLLRGTAASRVYLVVAGATPARADHPLPVLGQAALPAEGGVGPDNLSRPDHRPHFLHQLFQHFPLVLGEVDSLIRVLVQVKQVEQVRGGRLVHRLGVRLSRSLPDTQITTY